VVSTDSLGIIHLDAFGIALTALIDTPTLSAGGSAPLKQDEGPGAATPPYVTSQVTNHSPTHAPLAPLLHTCIEWQFAIVRSSAASGVCVN
jgi:hypothetical protein